MKRMKPKEVFEYLDEEWKWIAKYPSDRWFASAVKPDKAQLVTWNTSRGITIPIAIDFDGPWEESLFERPKKKVKYYLGDFAVELYYEVPPGCPTAPDPPPAVAAWFRQVMEQSK